MKERLDVLLLNQGLVSSRERAKALIMEGLCYVNGQKEDKPGTKVDLYARIEVRGQKNPFVSRGGLKLQKALETWPIDLSEKIAMDVGASTGGFTDCMLKHGAGKVYAVDVGYGQLAWSLRNDERVVNLEKTNVRYITRETVPEEIGFVSVDVSFISLEKIFPPVKALMGKDAEMVALIKPQFEAGREKVGKKGVVRDEKTHAEVIRKVLSVAKKEAFTVLGLTYSPVKGPEGNIEYLIYLKNTAPEQGVSSWETSVEDLVRESHEALKSD